MLLLLASPKGTASLHIVFGGHNIPHPDKVGKCGEDAFFADDEQGAFGIADGVGGSARNGIDPGLFSRELLQRCHACLPLCRGGTGEALRMATEFPMDMGGSTTLVLGQLEAGTDRLTVYNLGDSGAMVLRPSIRHFPTEGAEVRGLYPRTVLRSHDQNHGWNWPFQASASNLGGVVNEADELSTRVREGDVLIAATDGVLDNLFDSELIAIVSGQLPYLLGDDARAAQMCISLLTEDIAKRAALVGRTQGDPSLKTPFGAAAAAVGYERAPGGKVDDVAIVCGVVRSGARPKPRVQHNFRGAIEGAAPVAEAAAVELYDEEAAKKAAWLAQLDSEAAWKAGRSAPMPAPLPPPPGRGPGSAAPPRKDGKARRVGTESSTYRRSARDDYE